MTPSASGSAYYELEPSPRNRSHAFSFQGPSSALKLTCTVHGPKPLPRSAPFAPHAILSTHIKYAPFAAGERKGYLRDASERDLSVHLDAALRGIIIGDRWPKSGIEVIITVLEGDEVAWKGDGSPGGNTLPVGVGNLGMMNVLAGCITVASAAIADAGIDCLDLVTGGVAAIVTPRQEGVGEQINIPQRHRNLQGDAQVVRDPCAGDHENVVAACVVGHLSARDELTELWLMGNIPTYAPSNSTQTLLQEALMDEAVASATEARRVLEAAVMEGAARQSQQIIPDKTSL